MFIEILMFILGVLIWFNIIGWGIVIGFSILGTLIRAIKQEVVHGEKRWADSLGDSPEKQVAVERLEITVVKTHWAPYWNEGSHLINK